MHFADIESLSNLISEKGAPCEFGCDENLIEKIQIQLEKDSPSKKIRIVKHWVIWQLSLSNEITADMVSRGFQPQMLYSPCVVWDRFNPGAVGKSIRSTLLVKFSDNFLFETKNTIYILSGAGTIKTVEPNLALSIFF